MQMTTGQKLKAIREHLNLTYAGFAKKIGIASAGHLCDTEKDKRPVSDILLGLIRYKLHVNPQWWETGEGEIVRIPKVPPERFQELVIKVAPDDTLATTTVWILEQMAGLLKCDEPDKMEKCAEIMKGVKKALS
jgi:transcriptional regulator with XRE-family HTH domain